MSVEVEEAPQLFGLPPRTTRSGSFGLFWLARLLSLIGTNASRTAIILMLANSSSSVVIIGLLIWCEILPGAIASFVATGMIDQVSKKSMMIVADLVRALGICVAVAHPVPSTLLIVAAVNSLANSFFNPARAATLPALVSSDSLTKANAWDQGASTAVLICGPLIGAQLFFSIGLRWALLLDAVTFLLSAVLIAASVPKITRLATASESLWNEIKDGWEYLKVHSLPRTLLILSAISVLSVGLWIPLSTMFVRTFLVASESVVAQQLAIFGLGGMCGSFLATRLTQHIGRGKLITIMLFAEAIAMLMYSRIPNVLASNSIIFIWGIVVSGITIPFYSLLQALVADRQLGRIFAIHEQLESFGSALAVVTPVLLQKTLRPQDIFAFASLFYFIAVGAIAVSQSGRLLFSTK